MTLSNRIWAIPDRHLPPTEAERNAATAALMEHGWEGMEYGWEGLTKQQRRILDEIEQKD